MIVNKKAAKPAKATESPLKPWHIALFVIAGLLVVWQVVGYVNNERAAHDIKYDKAKSTVQYAPGSKQEFWEKEK